jgi:hypothetical protein
VTEREEEEKKKKKEGGTMEKKENMRKSIFLYNFILQEIFSLTDLIYFDYVVI